jgi:amino acid permease
MATSPVDKKPLPYDNALEMDIKDKEAIAAETSYVVDVDYRGSGLKRSLKARHLNFISIGACIG